MYVQCAVLTDEFAKLFLRHVSTSVHTVALSWPTTLLPAKKQTNKQTNKHTKSTKKSFSVDLLSTHTSQIDSKLAALNRQKQDDNMLREGSHQLEEDGEVPKGSSTERSCQKNTTEDARGHRVRIDCLNPFFATCSFSDRHCHCPIKLGFPRNTQGEFS